MKTDTATDTAKRFLDNYFCEYGLPERIVSDRDAKFTLLFWKEFHARVGVKLAMSTAFHPQADGQIERMNRFIMEMLRTMGVAYRGNWNKKLKVIQFNINNSISTVPG